MKCKCKNIISLIVEEIFPFGYYLIRVHRKTKLCNSENIVEREEFKDYLKLSTGDLEQRLKEERGRASAMDEKTFKLTFSFSVALTVLSLMAAFVTKTLEGELNLVPSILICLGFFYVLAAGLVSVGALRTQRLYGYGSQFLLYQQEKDSTVPLVDSLARQETTNLIRHLRNETAFQALRNGIWLLFVGLLIFAATLVYRSLVASCYLSSCSG